MPLTWVAAPTNFRTALYCDAQGNLVVLGRTYSSDYPGTVVGSGGGCDMVVTKLNATGSALDRFAAYWRLR